MEEMTTLPANETIRRLAEQYPKCFSLAESKRWPLANIHDALMANVPPEERPAVLFALRIYVNNSRYLAACYTGAPRIGLDGEIAGHVTEKEARYAARRHAELTARRYRQRQERQRPKARPGALTLSDLRAAAQARKERAVAAG
jgi:ProP effector